VPIKEVTNSTNVCHRTVIPYKERWTNSTNINMCHTRRSGQAAQMCHTKRGGQTAQICAIQGEVDKQHKYVPYKERWTSSTNVPYKERWTNSINVCHRRVVPYKERWTNSTKYRFEQEAY